jgi:hypothetical protein
LQPCGEAFESLEGLPVFVAVKKLKPFLANVDPADGDALSLNLHGAEFDG